MSGMNIDLFSPFFYKPSLIVIGFSKPPWNKKKTLRYTDRSF